MFAHWNLSIFIYLRSDSIIVDLTGVLKRVYSRSKNRKHHIPTVVSAVVLFERTPTRAVYPRCSPRYGTGTSFQEFKRRSCIIRDDAFRFHEIQRITVFVSQFKYNRNSTSFSLIQAAVFALFDRCGNPTMTYKRVYLWLLNAIWQGVRLNSTLYVYVYHGLSITASFSPELTAEELQLYDFFFFQVTVASRLITIYNPSPSRRGRFIETCWSCE